MKCSCCGDEIGNTPCAVCHGTGVAYLKTGEAVGTCPLCHRPLLASYLLDRGWDAAEVTLFKVASLSGPTIMARVDGELVFSPYTSES